jgi:hypothetical protein
MGRLSRRLGLALVAIGTVAFAAGRLEAGSQTYEISGEFGSDLLSSLPTGLAGGSFSGTYTTSSLPVSPGHLGSFTSYNIEIYTSTSSTPVLDLTSGAANLSGILASGVGRKPTELFFDQFPSLGQDGFSMELYFPMSFDGSGVLIPFELSNFQSSQFQVLNLDGHTGGGTIVSAQSVPEPSSLVLGLLGSLGALGCFWRRYRTRTPA